jgi:hypothetical protein
MKPNYALSKFRDCGKWELMKIGSIVRGKFPIEAEWVYNTLEKARNGDEANL